MPTNQYGQEQPTQEDRDEQEFLYRLTLHVALHLTARAEAMVAHAATHRAVSQTIIESVINGKQYIALIWDAKTQGTHGTPSAAIVVQRYRASGKEVPSNTAGKLPTVLTEEELRNANAAAEEFSAWLEQHKPVDGRAAMQAFREIGQRHQSQDNQYEFIFTLDHARACLHGWRKRERSDGSSNQRIDPRISARLANIFR